MVSVHKTRINLEEIRKAKEIKYIDLDASKERITIFKRENGLWEWKEGLLYPHLVSKFLLTDKELKECLNDEHYDLRIEVIK